MLQLVRDNTSAKIPIASLLKEEHHLLLINNYLNSHIIRNHSPKTITGEESFFKKWFKLNGDNFYTWDAMNLKQGRQVIIDYTNGLIKSGVTSKTVRSQIRILSRYFSFVLEHPFVIPKHSYDGEQLGVPLDPETIYDFFHCLRKHYLINDSSISAASTARNYTMAVIAAESELRADEILHLELSDLFFKSHKIQTRYAKGTRGPGKRARTTLFTSLARDSVNFYLKKYRPLITSVSNNYLFLNRQGTPLDYSSAYKALGEIDKGPETFNGFWALRNLLKSLS
ncbi:MAG: hypothetical protein PHY93_01605 [Bacteriovorax sp.]|nr:hypothetical protein [Bacteriovorax sp.]